MKKQTVDDLKKRAVNKEKKGSSFDWLLLGFLAIVIILLVFITTK